MLSAVRTTVERLYGVRTEPPAPCPTPTDVIIARRPHRRRSNIKQIICYKQPEGEEGITFPLMLIFEDLRWIDSGTQTLFNLLVDAIANARILLLVNYRPEYRHEWSSDLFIERPSPIGGPNP